MTFRVIWLYNALNALAASYLYARRKNQDPDAITRAMARIDTVLQSNPAEVGESRSGRRRVFIENPLTVFFEVHDDEQTVVVTAMRYHTRRPSG